MITKKGDGSQVKESTDSSTTLEDDDVKGDIRSHIFLFYYFFFSISSGNHLFSYMLLRIF